MGFFSWVSNLGRKAIRGASWLGKQVRKGVNWGKKVVGNISSFVQKHGAAIDRVGGLVGLGDITSKVRRGITEGIGKASDILDVAGSVLDIGEGAARELGLSKFAGIGSN